MLNKVILIGRLSKEPEIRNTPSGKSVVNCSIATNKKWKDQSGQQQERVEFTNLVIWQGAEAFAKYTTKGSKVYIEGELQTRDWIDKETGKKRYATDVNVNQFIFLDNKGESKSQEDSINTEELENKNEIAIEDIPF